MNKLYTAAALLAIFSFFLPQALLSQKGIYNDGKQIYVESGTKLFSKGKIENTNSGSSVIENQGQIELEGNWQNSGKYQYGTGELIMAGSGGNVTYQSNNDSVYHLTIDTTNVTLSGGRVTVLNQFELKSNKVVTDNTNILRLADGASTSQGFYNTSSDFAIVEGPIEVEGARASVTLPLGREGGASTDGYLPAQLDNITASGATPPVLRVNVQSGPTGGTDGQGIGQLFNNNYWAISHVAGDFDSLASVAITETNSPANTYNDHVAQSNTLSGDYKSIGQASTFTLNGRTLYASDSIDNTGLGYFTLGDCRFVVSEPVLSADTICEGDSIRVSANRANSPTVSWITSADSNTFNPATGVSGKTASFYRTDTLNLPKTYFSAVGSDASNTCFADTTPAKRVQIRESIKLRPRVLLEGPFDPTGDTLRYGDQGLQGIAGSSGKLDSLYAYGGASDTNMYDGYNVPDSAVDIVEVEIWRDTNSDGKPDTFSDSTFAWLTQQGYLLDFYTGDKQHCNLCALSGSNDYFIVIRHRNHLPAMSTPGVTLAPGPTTTNFDLTKQANLFQGEGDPLGGGLYGMFAGNIIDHPPFDVLAINSFDYYLVRAQNGVLEYGYYDEDVNLDGNVNATDYLIVDVNRNALEFSFAPLR